MNLVTPKAQAKHELLFNKPATMEQHTLDTNAGKQQSSAATDV